MESILKTLNAVIWGIPVLTLILAVGIIFTLRSKFAQIRLLPAAFRQFIRSMGGKGEDTNGISGYRALCTALAATVGTGNIAGVAGAISIGGPGVIFWMWLCALLGMITKLAEVTLAVRYRKHDTKGHYTGGPMYMIQSALPRRMHFLANVYCFFGIVAALGVGNAAQINAVIDGVKSVAGTVQYSIGRQGEILLGAAIAVLVALIFRKGMSGVGYAAEKLVPLAAAIYILLAASAIFLRYEYIPSAFSLIIPLMESMVAESS